MLTLSQILAVAAPALCAEFKKPYKLSPPVAIAEGFKAFLYDPNVEPHHVASCMLVWSFADEHNGSEKDRVTFARNLLINAIETLNDVIKQHQQEN